MRAFLSPIVVVSVVVAAAVVSTGAQTPDSFRFKSGVELINVTATVADDDGRFVSGLVKEDFAIYEDGVAQEVTHFSNDRVPVSLGIALDTSGSMTPDKMSAARAAIDHLIYDLLAPDDELFFVEFSGVADLVQGWTTDRRAISRAVAGVIPSGGTAIYDAIVEALPTAEEGRNRKKALLLISDGNDTNSNATVGQVRQMIRQSEVLVYALGVDGTSRTTTRINPQVVLPPFPFPFPGGGGGRRPQRPPIGGGGGTRWPQPPGERVNADALRQITDDTGGRTEIVRGFSDLNAATARIADELSKQYYLGYSSTGKKDGRWHAIRVVVKDRALQVRARRGFVAS